MRRQRNLLGPQGMGGMVSLWGASSAVKQIQYGTITGSSSATISSVVVENSIVLWLGNDTNDNAATTSGFTSCILSNSTTVSQAATAAGNVGGFCVLEFLPGMVKSAGSGTIAVSGVGSATATITSVNTSKTILTFLGQTTNDGTPSAQWCRLALTNSTTITASRTFASNLVNIRYSYLEFY